MRREKERQVKMIELRHLKKQYDMSTPLVDVNATINKGDIIAVIGPSGTGKSTLLRCINLLETPTSGQIFVDDEEITNPKCDLKRIRHKIGMVFQSFNLYEHLTVVENCMLAQTVLLKRTPKEAYEKSMELLLSVGMDAAALKYPSSLSGGQKQRAAIARTLSTDPEIILFDEPTSALDPLSVNEVEKVIEDFARQGRTMMIVTHSMEFARRISNRVFYLDQGGIYEEGTPQEIFDSPKKILTQKFVHQLHTLKMILQEGSRDIPNEFARIVSFCKEYGIEEKRALNACSLFEEGMNILCRYAYGEERAVSIALDYTKSSDVLQFSFSPHSLSTDPDMKQTVLESIEYKLLTHYTKECRTKPSENGDGVQYIFSL